MTQRPTPKDGKPSGTVSAWDLEPPVSTMFDIRMASVLGGLRRGDLAPIAQEIERGRLEYVSRFMTPEDNARLARALRTGSPLTQSEKRKTRTATMQRDQFILERICYWRGKGLPLFSHTNEGTAVHGAASDYSAAPISDATELTPESVYKHLWKPTVKAPGTMLSESRQQLLISLIAGLSESELSKQDMTACFVWFGESVLIHYKFTLLWAAKLKDLDSLLDSTNPTANHFRDKISELRRRTTISKPPQL